MTEKRKARAVIARLRRNYPRAGIALNFSGPLELLVAVILSAQCTDVTVNRITPALFRKYRDAAAYAAADLWQFEREIRPSGFYRNKARNIIAAARMIQKKFQGRVPQTMAELIELPGVARKTANVVLLNAYGKAEGIAVDTHVRRVSRRIGLTGHDDPVKIERDLMRILPVPEWGKISYLLIEHGRRICAARSPRCGVCPVNSFCDDYLSRTRNNPGGIRNKD